MIAVTGANGLLGSFIIRKLIENKQPCVAIVRKGSDTSLLSDVHDKIVWRYADVIDTLALSEVLTDITHVVHTAAMVSFNPREKNKIYDVNVQGTRNVVNACLAQGVKRLIHISSVAALGRQKNQLVIDENNKWMNSPLNSTYADSKYQAELEVFRGQEEGLETVMINPSVILAPADWDKSSTQLFKYVWQQKSFYIDGSLNYVDVRDVTEAVYKLIYSTVQNERFIVSAGSISFIEFFNDIAIRFDKKPPSIKLNKKTLKIVAWLELYRSYLTNSSPLITSETARLAGTKFSYNTDKIKKALNFEFQSIDKTLEWCCGEFIGKIKGKN